MTEFTPWSAIVGGSLIGLAAVLLMGTIGRIAGISGMLAGVVLSAPGDRLWRLVFIAGLLISWPLAALVTGQAPAFQSDAGWLLAAIAGLFVGFGTQLGSGCTSGHGVCGIARLSPRSLLATAVFITSGVATVALMNALVNNVRAALP